MAENVLEVTLPLTTATQSNGEFEATDEPGEFKVADASWAVVNCGAGEAGARINVGQAYTMSCGANPGNLDLTITENADYKFRFDATGADKTAPKLTITKVVSGGGGGGDPEPEEDSTIIRIHSITVVASAAGPAGVESVKTVKGIGNLSVDELRRGGDARITRIEIENTGTNGDVGILKFEWTADAQFALAQQNVDIFYSRPEGGVAGTKIVVGGQTYNCVAPPPDSPFGCVVTGVAITPFANGTMTVQNADGSTETIIFNGGGGADDVFAFSGNAFATRARPPPAPDHQQCGRALGRGRHPAVQPAGGRHEGGAALLARRVDRVEWAGLRRHLPDGGLDRHHQPAAGLQQAAARPAGLGPAGFCRGQREGDRPRPAGRGRSRCQWQDRRRHSRPDGGRARRPLSRSGVPRPAGCPLRLRHAERGGLGADRAHDARRLGQSL